MYESRNPEIVEKLIQQTNKVLFCYDVDAAAFTFLNHAFNQIWRRTRESIITNPMLLLDAVHPDDKEYLIDEYEELLNGIIKDNVEFRIKLPDNTVKWLLLNPQIILDDKGNRFIGGVIEDITVAKENINNLQKFGAKKNSVLEILSHDLAGPLANIQVLAETLAEYTKDYDNEQVDTIIRLIRESSERNIHLIRDFVQQEFLESSNVDLFRRRVDLIRILREVIEQYQEGEEHIQKEIQFTSSSDKIYVYVDDPKFMQVINNLFSNSIKFTHDNGIISLDVTEQDETVLLTIKDNGIGIPKKFHNEIFDKFTRARREGLRGEPSTGLGMSIIRTIVEWHNGKIWFESKENEGTTFYIEIPKE